MGSPKDARVQVTKKVYEKHLRTGFISRADALVILKEKFIREADMGDGAVNSIRVDEDELGYRFTYSSEHGSREIL